MKKAALDLVRTLLALGVGSAPGLLFPVVVAVTMSARSGDELILLLSIVLVLVGVQANTLETAVIAEAGRAARAGGVSDHDLRRTIARGLRLAIPATAVLFPALVLVYAANSKDLTAGTLARDGLPMVVIPVIATVSAVYSGTATALGSFRAVLAGQALRSVFALAWLVIHDAGVAQLAWCLLLGEVVRLGYLRALARRHTAHVGDGHLEVPPASSLAHQALSMTTTTANPVIDRSFLTHSRPGTVVAYDLADKLYFTPNLLLNNGLILPYVRRWPELIGRPVAEVRRALRSDLLRLSLVCVAAAGVSEVLVLLVRVFAPVTSGSSLATGLLWSQILFASLPLTMLNTAGARLLVLARKTTFLPRLALADLAANVALDALLYAKVGAIGIPLATIAMRALNGAIFCVVTHRVAAPALAEEVSSVPCPQPV